MEQALGSGGWFGRGLGAGHQKLFFLPEARTDFILPVVGEELGFLGTSTVMLLFAALVACGLRVALGAARRDRFGFLLTFGLIFWIGLQAAGNVAVVMVTATLDPFRRPGSRLDVSVSTLTDAQVIGLYQVDTSSDETDAAVRAQIASVLGK